LYIPAASIGGGLVDMFISFGVFFLWMGIKGYVPSWHIVFLPLLVVLTILISVGIAAGLAALTVTYRDLRFLIPFVTQLGMWLSCVPFIADQRVPHRYQWILIFNPLFGIFDAYRSAIFGLPLRPWHLTSSIVMTIVLLLLGLFYFRKTERRFADIA